jgi:hypothetical protein
MTIRPSMSRLVPPPILYPPGDDVELMIDTFAH